MKKQEKPLFPGPVSRMEHIRKDNNTVLYVLSTLKVQRRN